MGWIRGAVFLTTVAVSLPAPWCQAGEAPGGASATAKKPAQKPRVKVTISKETTFITGPLRPDGYVDYVAAINDLGRKGVTPENNAAVLFWQAFGPDEIPQDLRERVFKMLGMAPLPEKGEYLVSLDKYLSSRGVEGKPPTTDADKAEQEKMIDQQHDTAMKRPWSKAEFPILAEWLQKNEKPLALIVAGSRRPRCYMPMIGPGDPMVISLLLEALQPCREAAHALRTRAMLRLQAGEVEEAWQDLLACHRLARLIGQGPFLVDMLVAIAIDLIACEDDAALAHHGKLTAQQAKRFDEDLQTLPLMPKFADVMNQGERLFYLDTVCAIARQGVSALQDLTGSNVEPKETSGFMAKLASDLLVDWDESLRIGNLWYDRFVKAAGKPSRTERVASMKQLHEELETMAKEVRDLKSAGMSLLLGTSPRALVSRKIGQIFAALLLPAFRAGADVADRGQMNFDLTRVALALAGYRADHGAYPGSLSELSPKYLAAVHKDLFAAEAELHYQAKDGGYVLYSVGANGKDDGGRGYSDRDENTPGDADWDDLVIRTPANKTTK